MATSRVSPASEGTSLGPDGRQDAALDVGVLGAFTVVVDGRAVGPASWRRSAALRLVKLLLLTPGHRLTREAAAERLWPERPPDRSQAALRKALLYARQALDGSPVLVSSRLSISLGQGLRLDLDDLEAVLVGASGGGPAVGDDATSVCPSVRAILAAGVPEILPDDVPEPWIEDARTRFRGMWLAFALPLARRLHASGARDDAHLVVERVLQADPADETAHQLAIELYSAEGRIHAARAQFGRCRTAVRRELDAEPSSDTVAVALAAERSHELGGIVPVEDLLVDRDWQMAQLRDGMLAARAGVTTAIVIRGPTGIGKSRVIAESIREAALTGWQVLQWRAPGDGATPAYAPLAMGLAAILTPDDVAAWQDPARSAIAGIVPGLVAGPVFSFRDEQARLAGVVAALVRLAGERPLLLAWDDLTGIDPASLGVLDAIVAVRPRVPLLVLASLRDDEPVPRHASGTLDHLRRAGASEVLAEPLAAGELGAVVAGRLGGDGVEPALGRQLEAASGGNPQFAVELAAAWRDDGQILPLGGRWVRIRQGGGIQAPDGVLRLVEERVSRLGRDVRLLLEAVAALPDGTSAARIASTASLDQVAFARGIDAAVASGLVTERGGELAFVNPLFRAAVRAGSRRRR